MFRPAVTDAARRLQALAALQRKINLLSPKDADFRGLVDLAGELREDARALVWWRRADNIRRGLLVTQTATAARNFISQVGRVVLDAIDQGLQSAGQKVFFAGKKVADPVRALDGLEQIGNIFARGTKAKVEEILQHFPAQHDRLFGTYHSDIARRAAKEGVELSGADAVFAQGDKAVEILNTLNRAQEFIVRRGVFISRLEQRLRGKGIDLTKTLKKGELGKLTRDDVEDAVQKALELTWAQKPAYGSVGDLFIRGVNKIPGVTLGLPFPRFMVNGLKFFYDFSPVGLLRVLSKAERGAIASGNLKVLSRATIGLGMLGAAYELRKSEYAGEKWYEIKVGGKTLDSRPFNPFAAYLFVGDVIKRMQDGTLFRLEAKDIATGILSSNIRAGTGLLIVDQLLRGLTELGTPEKMTRALKSLAGETAAGLLMPLQTISDVMAQYDDELAKVRETREEPFLGPIKAKIPGLAQTLPEKESPTREAAPKREAPLLRQLTGATVVSPKNPAEKELDRLQFNFAEIKPATGEPKADRLIARFMGPLVEQRLGPVVKSARYLALTDKRKGEILRRALGVVRKAAIARAKVEDPELFQKLRVERLPGRLSAAIEEAVGER